MPKESLPIPVLTPEQVKLVEDNYHLNIRELIRLVFNDPNLTMRNDPQIKAVRQALAAMGKVSGPPPSKKEEELLEELVTEEHKEYIRNNIQDSNGPLEIARIIFDNPNLLPSSKQCRAVHIYCRQLDPNYKKEDKIVEELDYSVPKSAIHLIGRVNKYAVNKASGSRALDSAKLSSADTQKLEALLSYMRMPQFKVEADKFTRQIDRDVFESTFVANCWDKPDMPAEHVLQFIQLSSLVAKSNLIDRMMQKMDDRVNEALDDNTPLKMNDVEALDKLRAKSTESMKQISALIKALTGERARLTDEKRAGSASMHNLVDSWKKQDDRQKIIQLAERRQKAALKEEIERFSSMDSLKAELFGLNRDNIIL